MEVLDWMHYQQRAAGSTAVAPRPAYNFYALVPSCSGSDTAGSAHGDGEGNPSGGTLERAKCVRPKRSHVYPASGTDATGVDWLRITPHHPGCSGAYKS
eukprot:777608-Prymnesium_polylepis.1